MSGDITKLPKWAQAEINRLTADEAYWKAAATAGPEDSNTFVTYAVDRLPLGDSPHIEFRFGDGGWFDRFSVYLDGNDLRISSGDGLFVLPQASNVVRIRAGRHD